jgi:beta-lactamase regulating signal transducer with metallopeptidase domain
MIAAILDHLWQSTLFTLCVGILTLILRRNGAHVRYGLWFLASLKFLIPFSLLTLAGRRLIHPVVSTYAIAPSTVDAVEHVAQPFSFTPVPASLAATAPHSNVTAILLALWIAGVVAVGLLWFTRWSRLSAALRYARPLPMSARLPVPVKSTASVLEPGLVGIWRPILLLPEGIHESLTEQEMNAVLAHELCHLRRRDNLTAAMHMVVEAVFWFYPVVWWLGARLIAERERACDESVLASGNEPEAYAQGILKVCRFYVQSRLACAAGVSGADLKKRVVEIMMNRRSIRLNTAKKFILAMAGVAALASPFLAGRVMVEAAPAASAQAQSSAPALSTPEEISQRRDEQNQPRTAIALDPNEFDKFVGFYQFQMSPGDFFTVTRKGDHFFARLTGQGDVEEFPESPTKFFAKIVHAQISFLSDAQGKVTELVLHQNGLEQHATRVDESVVKAAAAAVQQRIAEGKPDPEREALALRDIAGQQKGEPDLDIMSPTLIAAAKQQWPQIQEWNQRIGKFKSLTFMHVSQHGWDVYDVTYEHGHMILSVGPLTPDHKLQGIFYQSS